MPVRSLISYTVKFRLITQCETRALKHSISLPSAKASNVWIRTLNADDLQTYLAQR